MEEVTINRIYKPKLKKGDIFNKLTAIKYISHKYKGKRKLSHWLFACSCGKECIKDDVSVRNGHIKSCSKGCSSYLGEGIALENALYGKYKRNAYKRNLNFNIGKKEFIELTKKNCTYCNKKPEQKFFKKKNPKEYLLYNGIDRIDNNKGYNLDNCTSCCIKCNRSKNNMSVIEFREWINNILITKCNILFNEI